MNKLCKWIKQNIRLHKLRTKIVKEIEFQTYIAPAKKETKMNTENTRISMNHFQHQSLNRINDLVDRYSKGQKILSVTVTHDPISKEYSCILICLGNNNPLTHKCFI